MSASGLALLKKLVEIDSPTPNVDGVKLMQGELSRQLQEMGFEIEFRQNPKHKSADLLIATLKGQKNSFVTFVSHSDTVLKRDQVGQGFSLSEDGELAYGSGVIDNKGGLVVLLEGLRAYLGELSGLPPSSLRVVISPNEEAGSQGFNDDFRKFAFDSEVVLGFEPALDDGSIIKSRRGNRWYQITVEGIEGHAGRSKGEHVNAAHELSYKITKMFKLSNPKKEMAVNVGAIQAGRDKFNVICGKAVAKLDVRFNSFESRDWLHRKIEKILADRKIFSRDGKSTSKVSYTLEDDCPPFASSIRSRKMVKHYVEIIQNIEGQTVKAEQAGGAGDVNYMSGPNVVVMDGLGPVGGQMHTVHEFVRVQTLESRAQALKLFLQSL
jgi:glutamate carboxypeptidase